MPQEMKPTSASKLITLARIGSITSLVLGGGMFVISLAMAFVDGPVVLLRGTVGLALFLILSVLLRSMDASHQRQGRRLSQSILGAALIVTCLFYLLIVFFI